MVDLVYLETTVVGHVAGRIHPNLHIASRQHKTRRWWATAKSNYRLFISQLVIDECGTGDPTAAQERLNEIAGLPRRDVIDDVRDLADALMARHAIPKSEPRDALHVAIAAVHAVEYLATWNFKHIANATLRTKINDVIRDYGYAAPVICTPEELAGMVDDPNDAD